MNVASFASVAIGLETLRANPLRTLLSTLGIIIGAGSLVAVLALGDGMERLARREIERTTDVQTVVLEPVLSEEIDGRKVPRSDYPLFTPVHAADVRDLPGVGAVSLAISGSAVVEGLRGARRAADIQATLADDADFRRLDFAAGRYFTEVEAARNAAIVVVSHLLAQDLAPGIAAEALLDHTVRVNGEPRRVIGVLAAYRGERSRQAFVPLRASRSALPVTDRPRAPTLMVKAQAVESVSVIQARAQDWLARRFGHWEGRVKVETSTARLEQVRRGMTTFKLFLGAITGISLVVGGIGIMNVLLASVTERTREIGVRKAIGARPRDILLQFLAESVTISGAGSAVGLVIGIGAAFGVTALARARSGAPLYPTISGGSLLVVAFAAVAVGIAFGVYPALRASRLSPIDAIRHE